MTSNGVPWCERFRPKFFEDIVLDPLNRQILKNIIDTSYFPNLLFYGPPGTGKTTTIINLINAYQAKLNTKNKDLIIHLNASDERGIDIIRNQINSFVNSKPLFNTGMKFVILDEVDYMTTNAQIALRYLLTSYTDNNVRFCLICNYVSRIDESLQTEFVRMRFNQLPESDIFTFLCKIRNSERLKLSDENLVSIQRQFHSDIRSMINYIQTNQENLQDLHVISNTVWDNMVVLFQKSNAPDDISKYFREISSTYCIDPRTIIKQFLYYIVRQRAAEFVTTDFLNSVEHIIHLHHIRTEYIIHYFILKFQAYFIRGVPCLSNAPAAPAAPAAPPKKRIIKVKKQQSI